MKNIKAIAMKEWLHIIRDLRTLILIIVMPLMQLMIYGYAINLDIKHLETFVYDEDQTYLSRRLLESFEQSGYFDIKKKASYPQELYQALDKGKAKVGILIPPNFTKDLLAQRGSKLQLLIDGTDSNPANTALNTSQSIVSAFLEKEGLNSTQISAIDFRPRLWYIPDLKSSYFMVPGLIGLVLQLVIPMITATAIVREKERGNIEQLLVTPIKPHELMIGKLIPYVCIGVIIYLMIMQAARFLFHIPIRGNIFTLFALTLLFLTVSLGIGLWASTVADNQQQASQIVMYFAAPSLLLSGFIFPRETMPTFVYYLGYGIPLTYFLKIIRGIVLKGLGALDLLDQIIPLVLMGIVILTLSITRFTKRLG